MGIKTDNYRDFQEYLESVPKDVLVDMCGDLDDYLVEQPDGTFEPPYDVFEGRPASDLIEILMADFEENE